MEDEVQNAEIGDLPAGPLERSHEGFSRSRERHVAHRRDAARRRGARAGVKVIDPRERPLLNDGGGEVDMHIHASRDDDFAFGRDHLAGLHGSPDLNDLAVRDSNVDDRAGISGDH